MVVSPGFHVLTLWRVCSADGVSVGGEMESDETGGRTLVQVISEKYSPDNFPYCRGSGVGVVIRSSPQGSPVKGEWYFWHWVESRANQSKVDMISSLLLWK